MPAEYMACVASEEKKGRKHDVAQKICAISYYKQHGKSVEEAAHEEHTKVDTGGYNMMTKIFVPFSKVSMNKNDKGEDVCIIEGYISTDTLDSQGDVVELGATFDAVDEWRKYGNIREMHKDIAVGVAVQIEKHAGKGVYVASEIVDPVAKEKVQKGVYKGYSIGGRIIERDSKNSKKITKYKMLEVSVVDRPANTDCIFTLSKMADDVSDLSETDTGDIKMTSETGQPPASAATQQSSLEKKGSEVAATDVEKVTAERDLLKGKAAALETELTKVKEAKEKEDIVKSELVKMIEELKPEIKKAYSEPAKLDPMEEVKKMDIGMLTSFMLKATKSEPIGKVKTGEKK